MKHFPHTTFIKTETGCPPWGRGWCAALACRLEASAAKPGNVHPSAAFPDLTYEELVAAGIAIAPAIERGPQEPLGRTILDAIAASRRVTRSNANLGIVLLIAPLAAVPDGSREPAGGLAGAVAAVLAGLGPQDARDVWQAIAMARPGGMGTRGRWDLAAAAPESLMDAMREAASHDQIARLWAHGYEPLFTGPARDIEIELRAGRTLGDAIVRSHLRQLAREPDSLVSRKHGRAVAAEVSARAAAVLACGEDGWQAAADEFDRSLRPADDAARKINPGTTADLMAAALYILLRDGRLRDLLGPAPTIESSIHQRHA
jgi:triphosphoribosyl-dephospho-CoA synthase